MSGRKMQNYERFLRDTGQIEKADRLKNALDKIAEVFKVEL